MQVHIFVSLLDRFQTGCEKSPRLANKKVLSYQDKAPPPVIVAKSIELAIQIVPHPSYSPDIDSSDWFSNSKIDWQEKNVFKQV